MSGRRVPNRTAQASARMSPSVVASGASAGTSPFGIDAPELVALVRVAAAVERPAVARAHELVVDDVALGEIVVEVRARCAARCRSSPRAAAPHDVLVHRRSRPRRPRRAAGAPGRCALRPRPRPRWPARRAIAPSATARPSTWHSSGAFVRSPLSCAAIAGQPQQRVGVVGVDRERGRRRCRSRRRCGWSCRRSRSSGHCAGSGRSPSSPDGVR